MGRLASSWFAIGCPCLRRLVPSLGALDALRALDDPVVEDGIPLIGLLPTLVTLCAPLVVLLVRVPLVLVQLLVVVKAVPSSPKS